MLLRWWLVGITCVCRACNPFLGYSHYRLSSASDCDGFYYEFKDYMQIRFYASNGDEVAHEKSEGDISLFPCASVMLHVSSSAQIHRFEVSSTGVLGDVLRLQCGYSQYLFAQSQLAFVMSQATEYIYYSSSGCAEGLAPTATTTPSSTTTEAWTKTCVQNNLYRCVVWVCVWEFISSAADPPAQDM